MKVGRKSELRKIKHFVDLSESGTQFEYHVKILLALLPFSLRNDIVVGSIIIWLYFTLAVKYNIVAMISVLSRLLL